MRVPSPAASTIAALSIVPWADPAMITARFAASYPILRRDIDLVPAFQWLKRWVGQGAPQVAPHARHVTKVLGLAIAPIESGKNAEDFGGALRRKRRVQPSKSGSIEIPVILEPRTDIAAKQRHLHRLRHIDPGILQKRRQIVSGRTDQCVLEIEDPDPSDVLATGQP